MSNLDFSCVVCNYRSSNSCHPLHPCFILTCLTLKRHKKQFN
jgi:hypothetical protein